MYCNTNRFLIKNDRLESTVKMSTKYYDIFYNNDKEKPDFSGGYLDKLPRDIKNIVKGYVIDVYKYNIYNMNMDDLYNLLLRKKCKIGINDAYYGVRGVQWAREDFSNGFMIFIHDKDSIIINDRDSIITIYESSYEDCLPTHKRCSPSIRIIEKNVLRYINRSCEITVITNGAESEQYRYRRYGNMWIMILFSILVCVIAIEKM